MKSEVYWLGAGRYAWRMDGTTQRWHLVGHNDVPLAESLDEAAQQGLTGMTWAEHPDDLNVEHVEDLR